MNTVFSILLGVVIGLLIAFVVSKFRKPKTVGKFIMDFSDPMKDFCNLHLDEDLNVIYNMKYMTLEIETKDAQN